MVEAVFEVIRIDDNGCEYVVAKGLTVEESRALVDLLTARGHKQLYLARKVSDAS